FARYLAGTTPDYMRELTYTDRKALHHFKYFTWVEQQGKSTEDLNRLWDESFWSDIFSPDRVDQWDRSIDEFNQASGVMESL
ncbi:MAG: pyridoxal-5-phosphate-dependent protein subunit beta, partial [Verrucomicrobiota bacterium]